MAEAEKQGIVGKITSFFKSILGDKGDKVSQTVSDFGDKAREQVDAVRGNEKVNQVTEKVMANAKDIGGQLKGLKGQLGEMDTTTKATALGGAGVAAQGAVSTVKNIKNKQFGRAAFAAARTALGAVATVAAFKAQGQGQNIGEFAKGVLASRTGGKGGAQIG